MTDYDIKEAIESLEQELDILTVAFETARERIHKAIIDIQDNKCYHRVNTHDKSYCRICGKKLLTFSEIFARN